MAWTQEQCEAVFEDYWQTGHSRCPADQSVFTLQLTQLFEGQYTISGSCLRCGEGVQMGRDNDPRATTFRQWTDDERAGLVDTYFQQCDATCPVCESTVDVRSSAPFESSLVSMQCVRCGNEHLQNVPKE